MSNMTIYQHDRLATALEEADNWNLFDTVITGKFKIFGGDEIQLSPHGKCDLATQ